MKRRAFLPLLAGTAFSGVSRGAGTWLRSPLVLSQDYLLSCQSRDGAWRSPVYGAFKDGRGLTPLVLCSLAGGRRAAVRRACDRALDWILSEAANGMTVFPVHNASWLLQVAERESRLARLRPVLRKQLEGLQLGSALGWNKGDDCFGGWSYASTAVRKDTGRELAAMEEPNLSATVLALTGLRGSASTLTREAREFIERCQNFSPEGGPFEDGGFYQMPDDPTRNKAGVAGIDAVGRKRFCSYGSATADGLRGLLACGATVRDDRVQAAVSWLARQPLDDVPDLLFYSAYARTAAFRELENLGARVPSWRSRLRLLESFRRSDGSYRNPAGEMRENDPVVATALALLTGRMTGEV